MMALETQIALYTGLVSMIGFIVLFFNGKNKDVNTRIDELHKEIDHVDSNHLDRFSDIKDTMHCNKLELVERINSFEKTTISIFGDIKNEIVNLKNKKEE